MVHYAGYSLFGYGRCDVKTDVLVSVRFVGGVRVTRRKHAACALLVAVVSIVAGACGSGGHGSDAEEHQERQLFVTDSFGLEPGLAIVQMSHQGEGDFIVHLLSARQEEAAATLEPVEFSGDQSSGNDKGAAFVLAHETGPVNISKGFNIPARGEHMFDVEADGPWTIKIEQPRPSSAPKTTNFSGYLDSVTPFFQLSNGLKRVTMTNPLETDLEVSLLDQDGNTVGPALVDETDPAERDPLADISTMVNVPEDGIYLFDVRAKGLWTIDVTDVEERADVEQPSSTEGGTNVWVGSRVLLALLINLAWLLILVVAVLLGGLGRFRST